MITEWMTFTVKSTLYTLNTAPRGPNFTPLRSTTRHFREISLSKIGNAQNDPKHLTDKSYPVYTECSPPKPKISISFALRLAVFEVQDYQKLEMYWMTPEWPSAFNCQKYPVYIHLILTPRPKLHSFSLCYHPFSRNKIVENRKCTEWPQNDLNHLTVTSALYTLNTYPGGPNFNPFRCTVARFPLTFFVFNWGFWFPIGYNDEYKKIVKTQKLKNLITVLL